MFQVPDETEICGIGPVIAGQVNGAPAYYVDVVTRRGDTVRCGCPKRGRRGDRQAKLQCTLERIGLAARLRAAGAPIVLAHDRASFDGLVELVRSASVIHLAPKRL